MIQYMYRWTPNIVEPKMIQYANNKIPKPIKNEWKLLCFHRTFKYEQTHRTQSAESSGKRKSMSSGHETIGWSGHHFVYITIEFSVAMWKNADKSQIG